MAIYAIYGDAIFNNQNQRNTAVTTITNQAASRGLAAESPYPGYPEGVAAYTTPDSKPALRFCYVAEKSIIDTAATDLKALLDGGGYVDGLFATGYVRS